MWVSKKKKKKNLLRKKCFCQRLHPDRIQSPSTLDQKADFQLCRVDTLMCKHILFLLNVDMLNINYHMPF